MNKQAIREKQHARRRQERLKRYLIIAVSIFGLGTILWAIIAPNFRADLGEAAPELSADHVIEGEEPGPYNTNPPTSGPHYGADLEAGFYEAGDITDLGLFPEGYLVHNLEHGYVIFWYNCDLLNEAECSELTAEIQEVMDKERNIKVIAFPWPNMDVPVVMTSWTRSLSFDEFDPNLARQFVRTYRNQAPEPNAP